MWCKYICLLALIMNVIGTSPNSRYSRSLLTFLEQTNKLRIYISSNCSSCPVSNFVSPYNTSEFEETLEIERAFLSITAISKWKWPPGIFSSIFIILFWIPIPLFFSSVMLFVFYESLLIVGPRYFSDLMWEIWLMFISHVSSNIVSSCNSPSTLFTFHLSMKSGALINFHIFPPTCIMKHFVEPSLNFLIVSFAFMKAFILAAL